MKISFDNDQANEGNWVGGDNNHWVVEFDDGVVEHVSSGSPLFDQDRRIVGQLHGNDEYNDNLDYCVQERAQYGQFSESWNGGNSVGTSLRTWLTNDPNIWRTNTIVFPQITGTRYLCSEGWNYSITNLPAGSTVSWNASNNITINSNGFASSSVTHETGWIEATITNPCSSRSFTLPRIGVWIGTPNTEGVILQGGYKGYYSPFPCVFDFDYYYGVNVSVQLGYPGIQGMTNYSWSGHASFHTSDRYGAVFAPYNPGGYVMFHAQNACGQSIISAGYGPCGYYSMYPNPATNEVTFGFAKSAQSEPMAVTQSVDSDLSTATFDAANDSTKVESEPVNIIVYDQMQNIVLEKNGTTEKDIKLDTRNLSSGIYIVHVTVGDVLSVKQLVIK
ncbi:MAG: T9SS type A sorting domain-containing protein [Chloroflexia bacterium]|nr:T9SS type A sorting domain-containing protein [Chloroflexia bacterium]